MILTAIGFVFLAGLGAVLRALAGRYWNRPQGFALGTFTVNVGGSFLLGLLDKVAPAVLTVLGVGFLGTLTTYSSFVRDTIALVELRRIALAGLYLTTTLAGSISAAYLGLHVATGLC